jgi:hypothetical protein
MGHVSPSIRSLLLLAGGAVVSDETSGYRHFAI